MTGSPSIADDMAADGLDHVAADHHAAIDAACRDLRDRVLRDDPREVTRCLRIFERAILEHLEAEEVDILPEYATYAAGDVRAIRYEHATIRRLLSDIGLDAERQQLRAAALDRLIDILRAHAAHEHATMYVWADSHLRHSTRRALGERMTRSMQTLAEGELGVQGMRRENSSSSEPISSSTLTGLVR